MLNDNKSCSTVLLLLLCFWIIIGILLVGCATTGNIEWVNDDPNAVLAADEYDCENIALARHANIGICVACGLNSAVDECLHRKYGWTKITRY